jgi:hypothetical protein
MRMCVLWRWVCGTVVDRIEFGGGQARGWGRKQQNSRVCVGVCLAFSYSVHFQGWRTMVDREGTCPLQPEKTGRQVPGKR